MIKNNFSCYYCGCQVSEIIADNTIIRFGCFGKEICVLKCKRCNLVQLYPRWNEKELTELYEKYSLKKDFDGQKRKIEIRKWITKYLDKSMISCLEIGCGSGDTVKWLRKKGYSVYGIDKDPTVRNEKNKIYCIDFNDYVKTKHYEDSIFAFQVLEHVSPIEFISNTIELLYNDRSRFVFEVPNVEDPLLTLYKNKHYNKYYWYPYHLFFYSYETISKILKLFPIKFKVKRVQRYGILNHLKWIIMGKPGNWNPHIPIIDDIYKFVLTKVLKKSDTLILIGQKNV